MTFVPNRGQTDPHVSFLAQGGGYRVFFTPTEIVFALRHRDRLAGRRATTRDDDVSFGAPKTEVLRMKLIGGNPEPTISGGEELPGKAHYFIGNDRSKWRTNVPTYATVEYRNVYPRIHLTFRGNQGSVAYEFVVEPGADPAQIKLAFEGADRVGMDARRGLVAHLPGGSVRQEQPLVYQDHDGSRRVLSGSHASRGGNRFGFQVGSYDPSKPLVIDPTLVYSTYLGGGVSDSAAGIAVDAEGNAYLAGHTASSDFPTANPVQPAFGGGDTRGDAFVTKLSSDGSALLYSTYLGGRDNDEAYGIAVDSGGNAYVTGRTLSTDFPTVNPLQPNRLGYDAFVAKLSPSGSALVYSTYLGGDAEDEGWAIAVDGAGNAHVTGYTASADFATVNAFQSSNRGGSDSSGDLSGDAFVAKLNPEGTALVYSTFLGGSTSSPYGFGFDGGIGIAADSAGNTYVAGRTYASDFPVQKALQPTKQGSGHSVFLAKFNSDGSLAYSSYFGAGFGYLRSGGIAVDGAGRVYLTGSGTVPTVNALQPAPAGEIDAFLAKLDSTGCSIVFSTYLGGRDND
ncbi:MAG: hypothetical protein DMG07_06690, partial [Acidobacteria bacterium]